MMQKRAVTVKVDGYDAQRDGSMMSVRHSPSLSGAVERWEAQQPDQPFLIESDTGLVVSYAACARAVRSVRLLLGKAPQTVILALPGGVPAAIIWLAALTGGHRLVPCAPESPSGERARLGQAERPDVLIVAEAEEARGFACPSARILTAADLRALTQAEHMMRHGGKDVAAPPLTAEGTVRLTTSGTTGEPKGVVLAARQIAWTADQVCQSHQLTPADRGLCVLPFFHINAPVVSLCATLLAGGTLVIAPRFSLRHFWEWIERERITWASIVPTIVALLLTTERQVSLPGTLRFVRTASAPLPAIHLRAFEARFGIPVIETYGLSESASQVAANPLPPERRMPGSVGRPTGIELRICEPLPAAADHLRREMAVGQIGEICVRGPSVISGYEHGTGAASFHDGWFRTGDMGYLDDAGYLYITGRLREVINRGGEKVAPREIEELLLALPDVRDVAVVGEPHPLYGQRVVAFIVVERLWSPLAEQRLRDYCARHLSAYKVPEAFYRVDALPRNGNGKLARALLKQPHGSEIAWNDSGEALAHG